MSDGMMKVVLLIALICTLIAVAVNQKNRKKKAEILCDLNCDLRVMKVTANCRAGKHKNQGDCDE